MLNKMNVLLIIGIVFMMLILFLIFGTQRYQSIKVKNNNFAVLESKLKEAINTNTEIDINKLTNFSWDECYVFTPYYPAEAIYKNIGAEWTTTETYLGFLLFHSIENQTVNDDQYIMMFKKDSKVILSLKYNLSKLPVIFKLDNYKFASSNAKFTVLITKQYDEGKIKELVLKK